MTTVATHSKVLRSFRLSNLVLIERFSTKLLLRLLDQFLLQHLLVSQVLCPSYASLVHPLGTLMDDCSRAELLGAALAGNHGTLIV